MTKEPATASLLPTRQSLLSRLRDWQDQEGWQEFFDNYWRLIYNVARKSGLPDAEAQDVVQNTFIYLVRRMPSFRYNVKRGSFKSWPRVMTRSRICVYRRTEKARDRLIREPLPHAEEADADQVPDPVRLGNLFRPVLRTFVKTHAHTFSILLVIRTTGKLKPPAIGISYRSTTA